MAAGDYQSSEPEPAGQPCANNDAGTSVLIVGVIEVYVLGVMGRMTVAASLLVLAVGCAGGAESATSESESGKQHVESTDPGAPAESIDQQPAEKTISVQISDGKVQGVPARVEVDRGDRVRIDVTSDRRDELHVHGYDKSVSLAPGGQAAVAFVADVPGVFEVETHDGGLLLFQLVVR